MACIKSLKLNLKPRYKASKLACLQRWLPAKSVIGPKKSLFSLLVNAVLFSYYHIWYTVIKFRANLAFSCLFSSIFTSPLIGVCTDKKK